MSEYSGTSAAMRVSLRKLDRLQHLVGVGDGRSLQQVEADEALREEEERKLAALTPYQRSEYLTARAIRELRDNMRVYQDMEDSTPRKFSHSDIARCRQLMRKQEANIAKLGKESLRLSRQEKKEGEARELMRHVDGARQYYRQKFRLVTTNGDGSQSDADAGGIISPINSQQGFRSDAAPLLSGGNFNRTDFGTSVRGDGEFDLFFDTLQRQDHIMDKQFDRIHAGILRLHENANLLSNELKLQDVLIDDTEAKVDKATGKLVTLNRRLKETLKNVDSSRMCIYIFCFIVVLGLVGGILYITGVIGPKSSS